MLDLTDDRRRERQATVGPEQAGGASGAAPVSERVRALLSRAAEEQLLEQRQVSAVLGDLRALVEDVDERLATSEQVERVAAELRAVSVRLDAAEARSAELAERITGAITSSERRLREHVDDAVLALAEVVLRRGRPTVPAPDAGQPSAAPTAAEAADPEPAEPVALEPVVEDAAATPVEEDDVPPADPRPADGPPGAAGTTASG